MFSRTALSHASCTSRFRQWRLVLLTFALLCNVILTPQLALAQATNTVRIDVKPDMSLDVIRTELSRYITPEIESGTYRYRFDSVYVQTAENGPIIKGTFEQMSVQIGFLMPVDFSSRTKPIADECIVDVSVNSNSITWVIACSLELHVIVHPLPGKTI